MDRGDYAAIINDTKYDDWMYIVNEAGERGFIPKSCAIKHECHGKNFYFTGILVVDFLKTLQALPTLCKAKCDTIFELFLLWV